MKERRRKRISGRAVKFNKTLARQTMAWKSVCIWMIVPDILNVVFLRSQDLGFGNFAQEMALKTQKVRIKKNMGENFNLVKIHEFFSLHKQI